MSRIDPSGLTEWTGGMVGFAFTPPITPGGALGRGISRYKLKTKCERGQQWTANVLAHASVAAFGLPLSLTGASVTFNDGLDYVNPYVFNGRFSYFSVGAAVGGGYGYSKVALGNALSKGAGLYAGIDNYISGGSGHSNVTSVEVEECRCEN